MYIYTKRNNSPDHEKGLKIYGPTRKVSPIDYLIQGEREKKKEKTMVYSNSALLYGRTAIGIPVFKYSVAVGRTIKTSLRVSSRM